MKKSQTVFWILNLVSPLLLGAGIYLVLAKDTRFSILASSFLQGVLRFDLPLIESRSFFASAIRNYLCDMCWSYALVFCLAPIIGSSGGRLKLSVLISVVFSAAMEFLQYFSVISGTFDLWDVILEVMACLLAGLMIHSINRRKMK